MKGGRPVLGTDLLFGNSDWTVTVRVQTLVFHLMMTAIVDTGLQEPQTVVKVQQGGDSFPFTPNVEHSV